MPAKMFHSKSQKSGGYAKVDVEVDAPDGLTIVEKDINNPNQPPEYYNGNLVNWICNFSVMSDNVELKENGSSSYTVTVFLPSEFGDDEKHVCVYNPQTNKITEKGKGKGNQKVTFRLDFGDPPTGIYP
jgi:hypothetical protein